MAVPEFGRADLGEPVKLHWKILPARQREVLRACAAPTGRWKAYLAGGTALALHLGHRQSEDLDWFTPETLEPDELLASVTDMGFPVKIGQNQTGHLPGGRRRREVQRLSLPLWFASTLSALHVFRR